jgi:hypothetical protein
MRTSVFKNTNYEKRNYALFIYKLQLPENWAPRLVQHSGSALTHTTVASLPLQLSVKEEEEENNDIFDVIKD